MKISTLVNMWYGETQKYVEATFSLAYKLQPSIIFIDELGEYVMFWAGHDIIWGFWSANFQSLPVQGVLSIWYRGCGFVLISRHVHQIPVCSTLMDCMSYWLWLFCIGLCFEIDNSLSLILRTSVSLLSYNTFHSMNWEQPNGLRPINVTVD